MSVAPLLDAWPDERVAALLARAGPADVERALGRAECSPADLAALLAPAARPLLEALARHAQRLTRRQFGRTIGLYAPLYLSNACAADCAYCHFAARAAAPAGRLTLAPDPLRAECRALAATGLGHVLLVAGDAPGVVTLEYLEAAVRIAREYFHAVALEVAPRTRPEYDRLGAAGVEGVSLYMETYDRATYAAVHRRGPKRDFGRRLDALEHAGQAGIRRLNLGVLLGLAAWRLDAFRLGLHARHLQQACWRSAVAVSLPRLRHVPDGFTIPAPVGDAALVQLLAALRCFLPEAGIVLSTREPAALRDRLIPVGVTAMSAGSCTRPGGYAADAPAALAQFATGDRRPLAEVAAAIRRAGYDPVLKDFDRAFDAAASPGTVS